MAEERKVLRYDVLLSKRAIGSKTDAELAEFLRPWGFDTPMNIHVRDVPAVDVEVTTIHEPLDEAEALRRVAAAAQRLDGLRKLISDRRLDLFSTGAERVQHALDCDDEAPPAP